MSSMPWIEKTESLSKNRTILVAGSKHVFDVIKRHSETIGFRIDHDALENHASIPTLAHINPSKKFVGFDWSWSRAPEQLFDYWSDGCLATRITLSEFVNYKPTTTFKIGCQEFEYDGSHFNNLSNGETYSKGDATSFAKKVLRLIAAEELNHE